MYRYQEQQLIMPEDFFLPFGGTLNKDNRWVQLAQIIPWRKVEEHYAATFKKTTAKGTKPLSARLALGALIIQQRQGTTDRETVLQITENPYMQYFLGLPAFQEKPPFHHSMMSLFRKRLKQRDINQINEWLVMQEHQEAESEHQDSHDHDDTHKGQQEPPAGSSENPAESRPEEAPKNQGKLLLDATCAPADMAYPTDISLLNQAREKLKLIIDELYRPIRDQFNVKPKTYRQTAHKAYLAIAKQRRPGAEWRRKAVGEQLHYIRRDLRTIKNLAAQSPLTQLPPSHYRYLLVIHELYRQQDWMYQNREHRINDRIVSLSQPHVRPIVRGKARTNVEFGAKVAICLVDGDALIEKLGWDNFNEGKTLQDSVEAYRKRYGYYPEAVLADTLYRNRKNRAFCKARHIRLSGPKLGRRPKDKQARKTDRRVEQCDFKGRIPVEGKFGQAKRRFGLDKIYAMLRNTSETVIALKFLVLNLERRLRASLRFFMVFTNACSISAGFLVIFRPRAV